MAVREKLNRFFTGNIGISRSLRGVVVLRDNQRRFTRGRNAAILPHLDERQRRPFGQIIHPIGKRSNVELQRREAPLIPSGAASPPVADQFNRLFVEAREIAASRAPAFKSDHTIGEIASPFENGETGFYRRPVYEDAEPKKSRIIPKAMISDSRGIPYFGWR